MLLRPYEREVGELVTPGIGADFAKPTPPNSSDKRWKLVDATMRRLGHHSRGLIETLHTVQETFGYLDEDALRYVAASLRVPFSRAYGVATFYAFFTLKPAGEHTCVVCMGTACYIKGAPQLLNVSQEGFGSWSGADNTRRTDFSLDGSMPGIVRTGAQRLSMTRKSQAR